MMQATIPRSGRALSASVPTIEIKGVSKTYQAHDGGQVQALTDTTFDIGQGEFVALVGPSGCGKSTLLQLVAGLLRPTSGSVAVHGETVNGPRRDLGIVFQQALLLPWLSVLNNVLIPVRVQKRDVKKYRDRARQLLELVGLTDFENRLPRELSGGMQQRVAIARALVNEPGTLLMDEPFGALDAMTRETMNLELQRIWQEEKKTVLFVTHSISEAVFLADRVAVMTPRPGRIESVEDVGLARPRGPASFADAQFIQLADKIRTMLTPADLASAGGAQAGREWRHE